MHTRSVDGRTLQFGHSGILWRNAFLLYDQETRSLWHHQSGRAMAGKMRGAQLLRFPSSLMSWNAWRAEHPDTLILRKPPGRPDTEIDVYADRSAHLPLGIAVEVPGVHWICPLAALGADGLLQTSLADVPVAVVHHPGSKATVAYDRRLGDEVLDLRTGRGGDGAPVLRSTADGRAWRLLTGRPVPETGAGEALTPVPAYLWEVGAWTRQHPGGRIHVR